MLCSTPFIFPPFINYVDLLFRFSYGLSLYIELISNIFKIKFYHVKRKHNETKNIRNSREES